MTTPTAWLVRALGLEAEILDWATHEPRTVRVAWATCPRGEWLLDMAAHLNVDRATVVRAAAACVEPALAPLATNGPARAALRAASLWTLGAATSGTCHAMGLICIDAAQESPVADTWAALHAAAALCFACDSETPACAWADTGLVVDAVRCAFVQEPLLRGRWSAELVRMHLPYEVIASRVEPQRRRGDPETARTVIEAVGAARARGRAV